MMFCGSPNNSFYKGDWKSQRGVDVDSFYLNVCIYLFIHSFIYLFTARRTRSYAEHDILLRGPFVHLSIYTLHNCVQTEYI